MSTAQPIWKFLDNMGDKSPLDYGGYFVYVDETGVYPPEVEVLLVDNEQEQDDDKLTYTAHRFSLDKCTFVDGVLSENKFHPECAAWWSTPSKDFEGMASSQGTSVDELVRAFCSDDVLTRALAYRSVGEHWGWNNLDDYPITFKRAEARERYLGKNGEKY